MYIDFWWNLIIYTIPMEKTIKTGFLRRYGGKSAAVCASNSQPDLYQMSSIFLWELKQCNCAYIGILLKDRLFIQIRRRCSGGRRRRRRRRRRKTDFTDSICSEEYIFQFSAKSDNIYYTYGKKPLKRGFAALWRRYGGCLCIKKSSWLIPDV